MIKVNIHFNATGDIWMDTFEILPVKICVFVLIFSVFSLFIVFFYSLVILCICVCFSVCVILCVWPYISFLLYASVPPTLTCSPCQVFEIWVFRGFLYLQCRVSPGFCLCVSSSVFSAVRQSLPREGLQVVWAATSAVYFWTHQFASDLSSLCFCLHF